MWINLCPQTEHQTMWREYVRLKYDLKLNSITGSMIDSVA